MLVIGMSLLGFSLVGDKHLVLPVGLFLGFTNNTAQRFLLILQQVVASTIRKCTVLSVASIIGMSLASIMMQLMF